MFFQYLFTRAWTITRLRHFEFLSISADHFRLLPQAAQGTGIFTVFYAEMAESYIKV